MAAGPEDAMMTRFVADYLSLLDQRVLTIQAQLRVGNTVTAQIAMLSLESTSTMVGAGGMAQIVGDLRTALEAGDRTELAALSGAMVAEARQLPTSLALRDGSLGQGCDSASR